MTKVDELVEWVAEQCLMWEMNRLDGRMEHTAAILARQILSHPDLALIDREKTEGRCSSCCGSGKTLQAPWFTCPKCAGSGGEIRTKKAVIPLREAIKEVQDGCH